MLGMLARPSLYRGASRIAGPVIHAWLAHRRRRGKEDNARFGERLGHATVARPDGKLVWCHAASVGESLSLIPLLERIQSAAPHAALLMTTGTVTSAKLMAERLPGNAIHQYAPVDQPGPVGRFLRHWRPDMGIWVESELWPNLVLASAKRNMPLLLLNARMSARSAARWRRMPKMIAPLLDAFAEIQAQSAADAARFAALGAPHVRAAGNLKYDAPPLPADDAALAALKDMIGQRPVWLAASTHEGEEEIIAATHERLREKYTDLLTIIVPRHPERGPLIEELLRARGLHTTRRAARGAAGAPCAADTDIYLADTLGELGVFYRLADIVLVGGSLGPHGGHNPLEPARLNCALMAGPQMENFVEPCGALQGADALETVADSTALADAVDRLLADPATLALRARAAMDATASLGGGIEAALAAILPHLRATDAPASHAQP